MHNTSFYSLNCCKAPFEYISSGIQHGVAMGSSLSKQLDIIKNVQKVGSSILKVAKYVPSLVETLPISLLETPLKDVKRFCNFFMGFRSLEAITQGRFFDRSWKIRALNIAGLALFIFTIIELLERFTINVSNIHEAFKKVPFFGVLLYAGLLDLSLLTLSGAIFLMNLDKKSKLANSEQKIHEKIETWKKPLDRSRVQTRLEHYGTKEDESNTLETKKVQWQRIHDQFDLLTDQIADFQQKKLEKWEKKLEKIALEKRVNKIALWTGGSKIVATLMTAVAALSGVGITVALGISMIVGLLEAGGGLKSYFMKRTIAAYKFQPVIFPEISI
ncbi:MAG: hypothetical protein ACHQUC_07510 [Chlamydiales bacterium]